MFQAADSDGEFFDFLSPFDDCGVSPEVGVSRGDVANTLMVAMVVVVIDEGADLAGIVRLNRLELGIKVS